MGSIVYLNGQLCPREQANVSVMDRGFLFGEGVYEVVRCYEGRWFRMRDHGARLARSMAALSMGGFEVSWLEGIGNDLLKANHSDGSGVILYVQVTRGADTNRAHRYPMKLLTPTSLAFLQQLRLEADSEKAAVVIQEDQRWGRCDIKSISLLGHVMAATEAQRAKADEAILVREGVVTEGSSTNVAIVREGRVVTHPESPKILSGISRKVMLEICGEMGVAVEQRPFGVDELHSASEVFLMGTTHEIWPVGKIDGKVLEGPQDGGLTGRLMGRFSELTRTADRIG